MHCIDADSHILPVDMFQYVDQKFKDRLPDYTFLPDGRLDPDRPITVDPNGDYNRNRLASEGFNNYGGRTNISSRLMDMEAMKVGFQILNPDEYAIRFSYLIDKDLACAMAYSYNRTIKKIVDQHPDKFRASLLLPLQDMDWSLQEIAWGKENGFTNVTVDTCWPSHNDPISEPLGGLPRIDDLFAKCVENDMVITVHEQSHQRTLNNLPMFYKYNMRRLVPSSHNMALISLITTHTLTSHPDVKILFAESGVRFVPRTLEYLENIGFTRAGDYIGKNLFFTIETEERDIIKSMIKYYGAKCLLFATDYPHDDLGGQAKFQDYDNIMSTDVSNLDRELIMSGNARRLFRI